MASRKSDIRLGAIDKAAQLQAQPLFRDLSPGGAEALCRNANVIKLFRGEAVFNKGDAGDYLYVVVDGTVRATSGSADGRTAMLNLIGKGDIFGEIAALDGLPRSTDVIAHSDCILVAIPGRDLLRVIDEHPQLATKFLELLCRRLRWTSGQVERLMLQTIPARLAGTLVRLAERETEGTPSRIEMTQQQIGEMAGMSRESVNKLLALWAAEGWVRLGPGYFDVVQIEALRAVFGED
jgi:CRP/FNR family transcriptional regulator, cyclic AMP receptor protein